MYQHFVLLYKETNAEALTLGSPVKLTSDLRENAVLNYLLNSLKLTLEDKTAFLKLFLSRYMLTIKDIYMYEIIIVDFHSIASSTLY